MDFSGDLAADLESLGLHEWYPALQPKIAARLDPHGHGDMPGWLRGIDALPKLAADGAVLNADVIRLLQHDLAADQQRAVREALLQLSPWRKGPFDVGGVLIDAEWQSDLKWRRVQQSLSVNGRRVLDVGCGNGYYGLRMLGDGASCVIGIDPTELYVLQFRALQSYLPELPIHILPLRLQELPDATAGFDTVFSMGVLYHQRSPIDHLQQLRRHLLPAGELLLETLVLPGDGAVASTPEDRYARMRNVWLLPTVAELSTWLARCGYQSIRCHGTTLTTVREQRSTDWMPFESLREALDPGDPARTIEGWPGPLRAIFTAHQPG